MRGLRTPFSRLTHGGPASLEGNATSKQRAGVSATIYRTTSLFATNRRHSLFLQCLRCGRNLHGPVRVLFLRVAHFASTINEASYTCVVFMSDVRRCLHTAELFACRTADLTSAASRPRGCELKSPSLISDDDRSSTPYLGGVISNNRGYYFT
eukprot:8192990-Pyramimonas_sp.AAC.3